MKNIIQNIIKNNIGYILKDVSLLFLLNKKELNSLFFSLIKKDIWIIRYMNNPTEEMQLEAVKNSSISIKFIQQNHKTYSFRARI